MAPVLKNLRNPSSTQCAVQIMMYCRYQITGCQIKRAIPHVLCLTKRRANSVDLTCALAGTEVVRCLGDLLATGVMTPDVRQRAESRTSQTPGRGRRGDDGVLRRVRAARWVEDIDENRARVACRWWPGGAAWRCEVRDVVMALIAEILFIRWMEVSSLGCVGA